MKAQDKVDVGKRQAFLELLKKGKKGKPKSQDVKRKRFQGDQGDHDYRE